MFLIFSKERNKKTQRGEVNMEVVPLWENFPDEKTVYFWGELAIIDSDILYLILIFNVKLCTLSRK